MKLDIGAGNNPTGNVNIDIILPNSKSPNFIRCDDRDLPFSSSSFKHVYANHVLEHHSWRELDKVLNEWLRVLKTGGMLELITPNLRSFKVIGSIIFGKKFNDGHGFRGIYGDQAGSYQTHGCGFTPRLMKKILYGHPLTDIEIKQYGEYDFIPLMKNRYIRWFYRKIGLLGFPFMQANLHITARKMK